MRGRVGWGGRALMGCARFLADIKKGASLSASQRIKSNVIPLVTGLSFVCGCRDGVQGETGLTWCDSGSVCDACD